MTISEEAVIVAGSAFYGPVWRDIVEERASGFEHAISQMRSMLEAAAPFIRAQALEDAAADFGNTYHGNWLRARAVSERGES